MSNMKYDAIVNSGIEVVNRISIPDDLIPEDAQVEMEAKKAAGYFTKDKVKSGEELKKVKGRKLKNNFSPEQVDFLLSPAAIRASAGRVFQYTQAGKGHFRYHPEKLSPPWPT